MFTQGLFLLAFALVTGIIIFINNLIKSGPFPQRVSQKESALLDFSDQVRYFSENSRDNCRNSLIFKKMTGRHAPIRIINLVFSCYDPHLATYIYSKAPRYLYFVRSELENWQLQEPTVVRNRFLRSVLWLLGINGFLLLGLSLHTIVVLLGGFSEISAQPGVMRFYVSSVLFLLCMCMVAIAYCQYAYRESVFLELVRTFYADKPAPSSTLIRSVFNSEKVSDRRVSVR